MANSQYHRSSNSGYNYLGLTEVLTADDSKQLQVEAISAYNGTASPLRVGLFSSIINDHYKVFTVQATDVEVTDTIQAGSEITMFTTTGDHGVLFQSKEKFNMIAFNISQEEADFPAYTYQYLTDGGWADLTLVNTPSYVSTGIQVAVFNAPVDWIVGDNVFGGDDTLYTVKVLATTPPTQAVKIDSLKLGRMIKYSDYVPAYGALEVDFKEDPYLLQSQESIIPFFSYASASNTISIDYKINS